jgi:hypothetical protein
MRATRGRKARPKPADQPSLKRWTAVSRRTQGGRPGGVVVWSAAILCRFWLWPGSRGVALAFHRSHGLPCAGVAHRA